MHRNVEQLDRELKGDPVRERLSEADTPGITELVGRTARLRLVDDRACRPPPNEAPSNGPRRAVRPWRERFDAAVADLDALVADLDAAGGTWTRR